MSSLEILKSKTSPFSIIRCSLTDLGIQTNSRSRHQRISSWAVDLLYLYKINSHSELYYIIKYLLLCHIHKHWLIQLLSSCEWWVCLHNDALFLTVLDQLIPRQVGVQLNLINDRDVVRPCSFQWLEMMHIEIRYTNRSVWEAIRCINVMWILNWNFSISIMLDSYLTSPCFCSSIMASHVSRILPPIGECIR